MQRGSNYVLYACVERLCSIVDHERVARLRRVDFITVVEHNNARNNLDKIISKLRQSLGSLQIINYRVTFAHTNLRVFPYLEPVITTLLFSIISHGRDDRHWMETAGQITFPRGGSKDVSYSAILPPGPN